MLTSHNLINKLDVKLILNYMFASRQHHDKVLFLFSLFNIGNNLIIKQTIKNLRHILSML